MNGLRAAATFLTRIPLHPRNETTEQPDTETNVMARAVPWFPVVGAAIGALQAGVYLGALELVTPLVAAIVSMIVAALVTGAFHHDGLADMADAFGGGWTVEQRMEILKDSRLGTYGVTALALVLALEAASVSALSGGPAAAVIVTAHTLSRAAAIGTMLVARPAGSSGLGVDYLRGLSRPAVGVAVLASVALAIGLYGRWAAVVIVAAVVGATAVVLLARAKIGGITGDVLGAVQQIAKAAILVASVAVA